MNTPHVSIVIPTYNRPGLLPVAVRSALNFGGDSVEVIVVPNGPDQSYKASLNEFCGDDRVQAHPIDVAHGNVARNYGMRLARGKYLRFLDDDDYLLPDAVGQVRYIEDTSSEICSGLLGNVDQMGADLGTVGFPDTNDFVCAAVKLSGFTLPTGNIFLRTALKDCFWDPAVDRAQDYCWMLDLAANREWSWSHFGLRVGVWYQHDSARVSSTSALRGREHRVVDRLLGLFDKLTYESRMLAERRECLATSLWHYIHRGFPHRPIYWSRIAQMAEQISPGARPEVHMFRHGFFEGIDPLYAEWMLLPARRISQTFRLFSTRIRGAEYRRRL